MNSIILTVLLWIIAAILFCFLMFMIAMLLIDQIENGDARAAILFAAFAGAYLGSGQ